VPEGAAAEKEETISEAAKETTEAETTNRSMEVKNSEENATKWDTDLFFTHADSAPSTTYLSPMLMLLRSPMAMNQRFLRFSPTASGSPPSMPG